MLVAVSKDVIITETKPVVDVERKGTIQKNVGRIQLISKRFLDSGRRSAVVAVKAVVRERPACIVVMSTCC